MTQQKFKDTMRLNRGRLSSKHIEANMDYIYDNGSAPFVGYMLNTKKIGIDNAAKIVDELTRAEQSELITWLETKPATISAGEIELKVIRIQGDR